MIKNAGSRKCDQRVGKKINPMKKIYFRKTKAALATLMLLPFFSFAQINLLQTTNNAVVLSTGVLNCNTGGTTGYTTTNSYARLYNLTALGYSSFAVTKVSFAVQQFFLGSAATFPVKVEVYSSTGGAVTNNLTKRGEATVNLTASMIGTVVEVPLPAPVLVSSPEMLIVVSAPDGVPTSSAFYIGGNSNGQTAPAYLRASGCGANDFTSYSAVGGQNMHVVLFPTGNAIPIILSVENSDSSNKTISLYPNPVKSVLNFTEEISNIKITDLTGRTIKQIPASSKSVDVATLENGTYIITATIKTGNMITKKFIKD